MYTYIHVQILEISKFYCTLKSFLLTEMEMKSTNQELHQINNLRLNFCFKDVWSVFKIHVATFVVYGILNWPSLLKSTNEMMYFKLC